AATARAPASMPFRPWCGACASRARRCGARTGPGCSCARTGSRAGRFTPSKVRDWACWRETAAGVARKHGRQEARVRVAFVKPNIGRMQHSLYVDEGRMEPLQLGVIAGLTPPDVDCVLYDDRMEAIPYDEPVDLVALTVETYTARRAYEIAG